MLVNSGLKATKIIDQRKAFYRQRIPEFSRPRKEIVDKSKKPIHYIEDCKWGFTWNSEYLKVKA